MLVFDELDESDDDDEFFLKLDVLDDVELAPGDDDVAALEPFCCFFFGRYL